MTAPLPDSLLDEVHRLTLASLGGEAKPEDIERLEQLLMSSDTARKVYARAIRDSISLRRWAEAEQLHGGAAFSTDCDTEALHFGLSDANLAAFIAAVPSPEAFPQGDSRAAPSFVGSLSDGWHGVASYLGGGDLLKSYLAATLLFAIGLLVGLAWRISLPTPERQEPGGTSYVSTAAVGRITALADCQWSKQGSGVRVQGSGEQVVSGQWPVASDPPSAFRPPPFVKTVYLGDRLAVSSGLMEITYDTGAKVILEGPCTYEIDSDRSGFLSVGRMTAKIDKRAEGGRRRAEKADHYQLPTTNYQLFAVRTPTAVVTDLGTEFGVEVEESGATRSHVFQGSVELVASDGHSRGATTPGAFREILREGQSARVERGRNNQVAITLVPSPPGIFVRQIPNPRSQSNISPNQQISKSTTSPRGSRPLFRLVDLGTLGGMSSMAYAINEAGQVVGEAELANGDTHAFLYADGMMKDLGTLGNGKSCAYGLNAAGCIVGSSGSDDNCRAFLYVEGKMNDLGSLGGRVSSAHGINSAGQIVGISCNAHGTQRAFLYSSSDGMRDLGSLAGPNGASCATAINTAGHVVGNSETKDDRIHAFLFTPKIGMKDLGTFGGNNSQAYQLNDVGQVIGVVANAKVELLAFPHVRKTDMRSVGLLGGPSCLSFGINNAGKIVGSADAPSLGNDYSLFLYGNGKMSKPRQTAGSAPAGLSHFKGNAANAAGWSRLNGVAINDSGQIAGFGYSPDGDIRAFLLTPVKGQENND